jgi:hypothetical protein
MSFQLHFIVHAQSNTKTLDTLSTTAPSYRLSFLFLSTFNYNPLSEEEGAKSGYNFLLGTGFMPDNWWIPAPHFYIAYSHYEYNRISMTSGSGNINVISVYPSIKLAHFLILGFGYSTGNKKVKSQYLTGPLVLAEATYSTWSTFLGIDIDLRIYQNVFFSFGIYRKEPAPFYALGVSFRM